MPYGDNRAFHEPALVKGVSDCRRYTNRLRTRVAAEPGFGADTDAVRSELGYTVERIASLRASGAIC